MFDLVLIAVISIYMLLGMPKLARSIDSRFPPQPNSQPLIERMSRAVVGYVKGQLLVSLIIGTSVGVGMWVLGVTGLVPGADHYALLFGAFAGITELIPYLGPILGAVPPVLYALVVHPLSAVWVVILFLFIHQVEGHVVVPNVMGSALRLHPLLVIFGLLAGGAIYGFVGILVALPLLAACRAAWEFFSERVRSSRGRRAWGARYRWRSRSSRPRADCCAAARRGAARRDGRRERLARGRGRRAEAAGRADAGPLMLSPPAAYSSTVSTFPATRLRRLRRTGALRELVAETRLDVADTVMPLFVGTEALANDALPAMSRHTVDGLVREVDGLVGAGVPAVLLFGIPEAKDDEGSGAWAEDGIVQQALRALRRALPRAPAHHRRLPLRVHRPRPLRRPRAAARSTTTRRSSCSRAGVSHAEAGADVVGPSDMMDGRVGAIRHALDDAGFEQTPIVAYAAKYASAFYGPFREAADSAPAFGDRRGYQMDPGQRARGAARVRARPRRGRRHDHGQAGAALPRRDPRRARALRPCPLAAYNVSGEYAMVKAAAARGWLDERQAALESLTAIRRAGADIIVTYWAKDLAAWL